MGQRLVKKSKNLKKKKFFFSGKFRPLSWVFGHQKVQKNAKIGCFDDLGVNICIMHLMHYYRGPQFRLFLSKFRHIFFFFDFGKGKSQEKKNHPDSGSLGVQRCQKHKKIDVLTIGGHLKRTFLPKKMNIDFSLAFL